jgi:translation initiation factor 1 (eIF-1/SUI1)
MMKKSFGTDGTVLKSNILQLHGDQRKHVHDFLICNGICNPEQIITHGF